MNISTDKSNLNTKTEIIEYESKCETQKSIPIIEDNKTDIIGQDGERKISKVMLSETDIVTDILPITKDTIVDIELTEDTTSPRNTRQKQIMQVYGQYLTKHLWQQGRKRQQQQPPQYFNRDQWTQYGAGGGYSGNEYDSEPLMYDPETRNSFVRLVMIITLVMLMLTAGFVAYVLNSPEARRFFRINGFMLLLCATIVYMIPNYGMMCFPMARQPPCCYFMLLLAMLSMSTIAAYVSCIYKTKIVLQAVVATAAIVMFCLALACTSFDFTRFLLFVMVISVGVAVASLMYFGAVLITGEQLTMMRFIILIIAVILQAVFLVIELQMILGGKSIELAEDDYALGAFMLYTSIVDIFIKMVQILGIAGN